MNWRAILDFVFPAQCADCDAFGSRLCDACVPHRPPLHVRLPSLYVDGVELVRRRCAARCWPSKTGGATLPRRSGASLAPLVAAGYDCWSRFRRRRAPARARHRRRRAHGALRCGACRCARRAGAATAAGRRATRTIAQRTLAAHGRFVCDASAVADGSVMLFDDVCTTGATLRDCARRHRAKRAGSWTMR